MPGSRPTRPGSQTASTLNKYERTQLRLSRLRTIFCFALLVIVGVFVFKLAPSMQRILTQTEMAVTRLNSGAGQLEEANLPTLMDSTGSLIKDGQEAISSAASTIKSALEAIESIDIETLNKAISDFSSVAEPLARLFGR